MSILVGSRLQFAIAAKAIVVFGFLALTACGGDHGVNPTTYSTDAAVSDAFNRGIIKIQTSPALTPSFNPTIHDYVVDCSASAQVQFSAQMGGPNYIGFFGPGDNGTAASPLISGTFSKSLLLSAGQRYRFRISTDPNDYSVRCLPKDFPPLSVSVSGIREAAGYVFSPSLQFKPATDNAPSAQNFYVIIVDSNGTPIWWKSERAARPLDAKILGSDQIVWTLQTNDDNGTYVIRNFSGQVLDTLGGVLDLHDFQPTPSGTYLAIRYLTRTCPPDCADMSPWGGPAAATVTDAQIFELDKDSNLLWSWNTRDHISLSETGEAGWYPGVGSDIIHMNAVEPDGTDGVIFSARHLNAIYHITKSTGAIDWKVGGTQRPESLVVLNDPRPTANGSNGQPLSGQHDVRKWPDGTVSVHDNGTIANRPPSIVRYQIDTSGRTAQVVEELTDMVDKASVCCGSVRRLLGGHWAVTWGGQPYMTELDAAGNPVLTVNYNLGSQFSYRAVPILPNSISLNDLRSGMDFMAPPAP